MQSYWEYSEKERSELTREEVETLLKHARMTEGIVIPPEPVKPAEDEPVSVERETFYAIKVPGRWGGETTLDVFFRRREDAEFFCGVPVVHSDYDLDVGSDWKFSKPIVATGIEEQQLCKPVSLDAIRDELARRRSEKDAYNKALKKYYDAVEKSNSATRDIWQDWREQLDNAERFARIRATFEEYLEILDGDRVKAKTFLEKAFDPVDITKAFAWIDEPEEVAVSA